jgi:hypothetical protein
MIPGRLAVLLGLALTTAACGMFDPASTTAYSCNCTSKSYPSCDDIAATSGYTLSSADLTSLEAACVSDASCTWSATAACPTSGRSGTCSHTNESAGLSVPIDERLRYYTPFLTGQDATCANQGGLWTWN